MADKGSIAAIKAEIDEKIIPNNNAQLITGEKLNDTLQDTVDTLDAQHRAAIQQVADDLDTEREVREAEEDAIRERIDEVDAAQASGVNSALQRIEAEKAAREGADESIRETLADVQSDLSWVTNEVQRMDVALDDETAAREELAQEVDQQGTRLTAAEGVGTTNTADIAVLTGKAAVAANDIQQLKNRATNDEAAIADHEQRITENAGAVNGLRDRTTIIEGEVGDLSTLHTTDKASLVRAINEVLGNPAIARYLFVSWSDKIRPHAANFVALMNNYDMIVVRSRGTVITTYHDISAIMYEYSEGWRIGSLEGLTLDDETSFRDMLDYLDEHSSFIASKADIEAVTGNLSDLTTEDKSSLVGAINEVKAEAKTIPDFARNLVPTGAPSEVEFSSRPTGQGVPGILGSEEVKVVKGNSIVQDGQILNNSVKAIEVTGESGNKTTIDLEWVKTIKDGDGNILFPDGLKGVGNVYDEAGQTRAVKRFGVVDLGSLVWRKESGSYNFRTSSLAGVIKEPTTAGDTPNVLVSLYAAHKYEGGVDNIITVIWSSSGAHGAIWINDTSRGNLTAAEFKTAMAGVLLIYELATPIEVTYSKQETIAAIEGGGIETAIADGNSAPFKGAILYGLDVYKTLISLVQAQAATTAEG